MVTGCSIWLVVEDNEDDFLLLRRACRRLVPLPQLFRVKDGLDAVSYLTGKEPYADRDTFPLPALILADLKMPRMDGLELLAWCKVNPGVRTIPFVMLTNSNAPRDREKAADLGVDDYLVKPTTLTEFAQVTAVVRDHSRPGTNNARPNTA